MRNKNGDIILRDYLGNSEDIVISGEEVDKLVYVTSDGVVYYHNKKQDLMKIDTRDPEGINSPKKIMDSHYFESPEGYEADGFSSFENEGNLQTAIVVDTAIQGVEGFRNYVIPVNQLTDDPNDLVFMTIDDKYGKGEYTMFVYDEDKDNVIEIDTINRYMPIYLDQKRNNLYYLKNYLNDENKDCKIMKLNRNLQPICIENLGVDYMGTKGRSIAISKPFWLEYVFRKRNSLYYYDFTSFKCNKVCDISSEANIYIKSWDQFKELDPDNVEPIKEPRENDYGNDDIIYIAEGYYLKKGGYEIPYKDILTIDTADVSRQMMDIINNEVYIGYSVDMYKNGKLEEEDIMPFRIREYDLQIDNNAFYMNGLSLEIKQDNVDLRGYITFSHITKWNDTTMNPGSMGFYNYIPFMECYSQVCVINGLCNGIINLNGEVIDFTGGKIYIEKNWGKSFPLEWLWVQCNSFKDNRCTLTCSLGHIPFPIKSFRGFLIAVTIDDTFYKFTTINKSKIEVNLEDDVEVIATNKNLRLLFKTSSNKDDFILCYGPKNGEMKPYVNESLISKVYVKLENTSTKEIIYEGIGYNAGIEFGGNKIEKR